MPVAPIAPPQARRTQQERRDATRTALLEAAQSCLCESGLLRFTTTDVCARAKLSQGALFRYFPSKPALLAATSEHLFATLREEYERRFARLDPARRNLSEGVRLLWKSMADPRLAAAFELYTAARTDKVLQGALAPIVRAHVKRLRDLAHSLNPKRAGLGADQFDAAVDLVVLSMQGLVLEEMAFRDPPARKRLLAALDLLARSLGPTEGG
jgi:AcrR family transcriptional regulator